MINYLDKFIIWYIFSAIDNTKYVPVKFLEVPLKVQVAVFLKEFKEIVTRERGLDVIDRRENLNALLSLGLTKSNCKHENQSCDKATHRIGTDTE